MDLNFLGRGAAFNPKEGNTSAFFIENNELFLIDCGENIFERIINNGLLNDIEKVNLMITHTHSDHIGSAGSLIMYFYYRYHKQVNIILPEKALYLPSIVNILEGFGCDKEMYHFTNEKDFDNKYNTFQNIRYVETKHRRGMNSYSIIFNTDRGIIYYSGDTKELNTVKALIESGKPIDKLFIDTTSENYPSNVHLYVGELDKQIPSELKDNVYCMHFNNDECINMAHELGFNVVEVYQKNNIVRKNAQ